MTPQDRNDLRTLLLNRAALHQKRAEISQQTGNFPDSIGESGCAKGLFEAIDVIEQFGREPANQNGVKDA